MSQLPESPCESALELLQVILDYVAADRPVPPQSELATQLGVTKRTIERWIQQLRVASLLRVSGRNQPRYRPIGYDRLGSVTIGNVSGSNRSLPIVTDPNRSCPFCSSPRPKPPLTDPNRSLVVVDHDPNLESTTTNPTRAKTKAYTETGRYLLKKGFNPTTALRWQHLPLSVVAADVERRWSEGARHGAIALTWEACPPDEAPTVNKGNIDVGAVRSQYGDLFSYDEPGAPVEGNDDAAE
jgi:hypothetical protein